MSKYNVGLDLNTRNSLSVIVSRIKPQRKVLEFGPANGRLTKYLHEELGCSVYAVEIDEEAAKDSGKFCEEIIVGNIEDYEWLERYKNIQFDYIVFADVLEHLYYPEEVLKRSKELLKSNGSVLISLPNVAHNAIIMELLDDQFRYQETGLLDSTHIRFFTKKTIDKLVQNAGFKIFYETGIFKKPEETEFVKLYEKSNECASCLYQHSYGEVYQFILEIKKEVSNSIIELDRKESALLFWDTGKGFNLEEVAKTSFKIEDSLIEFDLGKQSIHTNAIRIDPLEYACKIKIKKILIDGKDIDLSNIRHNGIALEQDTFIYLHHDPQISIMFQEAKNINSVVLYFDLLENILDIKGLQLQVKEQQLQEKEQQLQEKEQQLQEKNLHIQEVLKLADSMRLKNRIKKLFGLYK